MKTIKFDLPINCMNAKSIEELRDNFTVEILDHYRSGKLSRWMSSRKMDDELAAINSLDEADDYSLLKSLSQILHVDVTDEGLASIIDAKKRKKAGDYFLIVSETEPEKECSVVVVVDALTSAIMNVDPVTVVSTQENECVNKVSKDTSFEEPKDVFDVIFKTSPKKPIHTNKAIDEKLTVREYLFGKKNPNPGPYMTPKLKEIVRELKEIEDKSKLSKFDIRLLDQYGDYV
ncbi:hypothetical protein [Thiocystis violascens]|uniref:Uncharacterized protein n=1 Tax=Thiocystis violascens (strain ATCC 17096 / DSM 198 / 6111) TaxID=765911 RepID=I3Y6M1_THIV6|nr:hypothetical protein [Thiocystis violascens]AFL72639.1 hypothetical protein Thivi_0581 [Thiocystis violascens DSM 198]